MPTFPKNFKNFYLAHDQKQRLELTWIGKDTALKLEPRILLEDSENRLVQKYRKYVDPRRQFAGSQSTGTRLRRKSEVYLY